MKNIFPFLFALLLIVSCGDDDDVNNNDDNNNTQLSTPLLLVPSNNSAVSTNQFVSILFEWSEVANATQYLIEVSDDANFNNIVVSFTSNINERSISLSDNNDGTYFWRVRAISPGFEPSNYSDVFSFNFTGDDNTDDNPQSSVYGDYEGIYNSNGQPSTLIISGIGGLNGEIINDSNFDLTASQVPFFGDSINISLVLGFTVSGSIVPFPLEINAGYDPSTKAFTRTNTDISLNILGGAVNIDALLVELQGSFDGDEVSGSLELDDPSNASPGTNNIDVTFFFTGTKQ